MGRPRLGSLCTGYGGLELGLAAAGMDHHLQWVADNDSAAAALLAHRHPQVHNLGDVTAVDWSTVAPVDILTAGFPCQDISSAGRRLGIAAGSRSGLWYHVAAAIDVLRPNLVVIENVRGILSARADSDMEPCPWCLGDEPDEPALRALGAVLGDLADLGFDAQWTGLPAAAVGACHLRWRVFIIAWPAADPARVGHGNGQPSGERGMAAAAVGGAAAGDRLTLLPTPRSADGGPRGSSASWGLRDTVRMLPTPRVSDAYGPGQHGAGGPDLRTTVTLLPTPRVSDGAKSGPGARGSKGDPQLPAAVLRFGEYGPAVARHAAAFCRPAPDPTEPGMKGQPRLSPRFVEWMQMLPTGWVCDVPGMRRNDALRLLGNGVVPAQAGAALSMLLDQVWGVSHV